MVPLTAATGSGLSLRRVADGGSLVVAVQASEQPKAWLLTALLAAVVAVGTRIVLGWSALVGLLAVAALALVASVVVGNPGEGPGHDLGTTAATVQVLAAGCWIGVLWAAFRQLTATGRALDATLTRRVGTVAAVASGAATVSGLVLIAVLAPGRDPTGAQYRWAVWLGLGLVVAAGVGGLAWWLRRPDGRSESRSAAATRFSGRALLLTQTALLLAAVAASAVAAARPAPSSVDPGASIDELLIGYDLPKPFSLITLATLWRFDLVLGSAAIVAAGWYLVSVRRLRTSGRSWPAGRTASFLAGCAVWLLSTSSGASAYGSALFSVHMAVHMLLSMVAPILLVCGQPIRLATRTSRPSPGPVSGPRRWLGWLAGSRVLRWLSQPLVAAAVYVLALYGLYLTSVLDPFLRYHWGHLGMNLFFLATGYLFYNALLGVDLLPRRPGVLPRLGALLLIMPFHTVFGIVVMSSDRLLAADFYRSLELGWRPSVMADQRLGGVIAWVGGQLPVLLVVVVICWQWYRGQRDDGPATGAGSVPLGMLGQDADTALTRRA
nr:cytochrome c oxidase assembly protein [Nakamurella aerolata]